MTVDHIQEEITEICRSMYRCGFIVASEGNVSVRHDELVYITPAGKQKGYLSPEDIVVTDFKGRCIADKKSPSAELSMHLALYEVRNDISAIIHSHPPMVTAHAVAGIALDERIMPETVYHLGRIPIVPCLLPSTPELAVAVAENMGDHKALVLENHGAVTVGPDLTAAFAVLEVLEKLAYVSLLASLLGNVNQLTPEQVAAIVAMKKM